MRMVAAVEEILPQECAVTWIIVPVLFIAIKKRPQTLGPFDKSVYFSGLGIGYAKRNNPKKNGDY